MRPPMPRPAPAGARRTTFWRASRATRTPTSTATASADGEKRVYPGCKAEKLLVRDLVNALILGIVEGLTEFLPVSSTGHLILAGDLLDFNPPSRDVFYIAIQTGAMLAVLWEYRARFLRVDLQLWRNLIIAFMPAAVLGLLAGGFIKTYLFKPVPVAAAFIIGGLIILWVDRAGRSARIERTEAMTPMDALKVGFAQCFA